MFGCFSKLGAFLRYRASSSGVSIQCFYLVSLECELVAFVESNHNFRSLSTVFSILNYQALFGADKGNRTLATRLGRPATHLVRTCGIWWTVPESNWPLLRARQANYRNSYSPLSRLLPFLIRLAFQLIGQGTNRAAWAVTILYSKIGHGGEFRNLDLWFPKPALCL